MFQNRLVRNSCVWISIESFMQGGMAVQGLTALPLLCSICQQVGNIQVSLYGKSQCENMFQLVV